MPMQLGMLGLGLDSAYGQWAAMRG